MVEGPSAKKRAAARNWWLPGRGNDKHHGSEAESHGADGRERVARRRTASCSTHALLSTSYRAVPSSGRRIGLVVAWPRARLTSSVANPMFPVSQAPPATHAWPRNAAGIALGRQLGQRSRDCAS